MEPTEENIRAFEAAHTARAEPVELPPVVQRTLGDLTKKRVLHLHCGTGEATAALAELGAVATGVDARPGALETARERWPKILWVDGNPQSLPRQLRRHRFDLVYFGRRRARPPRRPRRLGGRHRRGAAASTASCSSSTTIRSLIASTAFSTGATTTSATRPTRTDCGGSARS